MEDAFIAIVEEARESIEANSQWLTRHERGIEQRELQPAGAQKRVQRYARASWALVKKEVGKSSAIPAASPSASSCRWS